MSLYRGVNPLPRYPRSRQPVKVESHSLLAPMGELFESLPKTITCPIILEIILTAETILILIKIQESIPIPTLEQIPMLGPLSSSILTTLPILYLSIPLTLDPAPLKPQLTKANATNIL